MRDSLEVRGAERYKSGVMEYKRMGYWRPDYEPRDTDLVCCFRVTPQARVDPVEAVARRSPTTTSGCRRSTRATGWRACGSRSSSTAPRTSRDSVSIGPTARGGRNTTGSTRTRRIGRRATAIVPRGAGAPPGTADGGAASPSRVRPRAGAGRALPGRLPGPHGHHRPERRRGGRRQPGFRRPGDRPAGGAARVAGRRGPGQARCRAHRAPCGQDADPGDGGAAAGRQGATTAPAHRISRTRGRSATHSTAPGYVRPTGSSQPVGPSPGATS